MKLTKKQFISIMDTAINHVTAPHLVETINYAVRAHGYDYSYGNSPIVQDFLSVFFPMVDTKHGYIPNYLFEMYEDLRIEQIRMLLEMYKHQCLTYKLYNIFHIKFNHMAIDEKEKQFLEGTIGSPFSQALENFLGNMSPQNDDYSIRRSSFIKGWNACQDYKNGWR